MISKPLKTYLSNSIIEYLEIPLQVKKSLFMYGVRTLADLDFTSDEELLSYHGIARKNLLKIRDATEKLRKKIDEGLEQDNEI